MTRSWTGQAPGFELEWGGLTWRLRLDEFRPGLKAEGPGSLLGLEGLAASGRLDREAFGPDALVAAECRLNRVEATYRPAGWADLTLVARWTPRGESAVDLEVEVGARSVDELRAVEVLVASAPGGRPGPGAPLSVEPRDGRAAALSYDGREPELSALSTGPPEPIRTPWLVPRSGREGWTYAEMVHPDDASRRVHEGKLPFIAARYGLFGYDLERGVVLRGRLRGAWFPKSSAFTDAERLAAEFLAEPPPLTT